MRLATLALLALAAALLCSCGGSSDTTTKTSTPAGATKAEVQAEWQGSPGCRRPAGASRWGCSIGAYRCQAVVTDRGWSVDCAKPGRSIAFTVPARK